MEYMKGIDGLYIQEETAVTLGKFDGVHRGHQKLLSRILEKKEPEKRNVYHQRQKKADLF